MPVLTEEAAEVYSDFNTPGVASSGEKEPAKIEIRALWALCDQLIAAIREGGSGAYVLFETEADINADLAHDAGTWGRVIADDGSPSGNGYYLKAGASGAGAWDFVTVDPAVTAQEAAEAAAAEAAASAALILDAFSSYDDFGKSSIITTGTNVSGPRTYVWKNELGDGAVELVGLRLRSGPGGGTINLKTFLLSGGSFIQDGPDYPVLLAPDTTYEAGTLIALAIPVTPDHVVGVAVPDQAIEYSAGVPAGNEGAWVSEFGNVGTVPDGAGTALNRIEVGFLVRRLVPVVSMEPRVSALELAVRTGGTELGAPIGFFDGNSLTIGTGGATPYPTQLAADLGILVTNFAVSGQNTDAMIADAPTEIDPYASGDGRRVIIAWEIYNQMRGAATPQAAAIQKMIDYCQDRAAAGWTRIMVLNMAAHSTVGDVPVEGTWNKATSKDSVNAELLARLDEFPYGTVLVDIGSRPELSDYDDLTYYQADKIHLTTAGQAIVARCVRLRLGAFDH